jgi:hypothetical protein
MQAFEGDRIGMNGPVAGNMKRTRERSVRVVLLAVGLVVSISFASPFLLHLGRSNPSALQLVGFATGAFIGSTAWMFRRANARLLLALGTAFTTATLAVAVLESAGVDTTDRLQQLGWWVKERLTGPLRIGIYRKDDPVYGWSHLPGTTGRHRNIDFDVRYTIDEDGCRKIPAPENSVGTIDILGCSYTFGHGVEDDECYPAVLASRYWTRYRVKNHAVVGWGTTQAYSTLLEVLKRPERPALVVYGWIPAHVLRNYRRKSHLAMVEKSGVLTPIFELENGKPVFHGLAGSNDGWDESAKLRDAENEIGVQLILEMHKLCRERKIPFIVISLPTENAKDKVNATILGPLRKAGGLVFDAREPREDYFEHGIHPKASWHADIARRLAGFVGDHLLLPKAQLNAVGMSPHNVH